MKIYRCQGCSEDLMPLATSLVREYTSQQEYKDDAQRLAKLGYAVQSVTEQPLHQGLVQRLRHALFFSAPVRLVVSYSDEGLPSG